MSEPGVENKAVVNIFGEEYPITGVTDPSHISRVADYIDTRMRQAAHNSRVSGRDRVAILAAMSIASELLELREQLNQLQAQTEVEADKLLEKLGQI